MTRAGVLLSAAVAALALAAPASAIQPSAGDYEAAPVLEEGGTYTTGYFSVEREAGKRRIVATEDRSSIYYPDVGKCDKIDVPLSATSIPISPIGKFRIKERIEVTASDAITVKWRGRWSKPKRVSGTITIKSEGCTSTEEWKGHRVP